MDDVILGLAAGYHFGDVRPFLASLRQSGFSGRCVLFVTPTTREVERMRAAGAEVVAFEPQGAIAPLSLNAYRYFLYLDFLRREGPLGRVLLTDVRDVLFQSDPFVHPWEPGLCATLEDRRMTIGTCPFARRWISGHLGQAAWEAIADRPISCSGTTLGEADAVLDYLERMAALLTPYEPGREMMAGYDQGVHNHLIHNGLLPRVHLYDNAGPILTLAYTQGEPDLDAEGRVLNAVGSPAVLVHQYDRKPGLFKRVRERYA